MKRTKAMQEFVDQQTKAMFGRSMTEAGELGLCVTCGNPLGQFRDELSRKEAGISGMCQKCQDQTFTED